MKHALLWLAAGLTAGLTVGVGRPDEPKTPTPAKSLPPAMRFAPTPVAISGANVDVFAVAVTADGKRIATAGGAANPQSGFVSVLDVETKKDRLALKLARPVNAVAFSPDGRHLAYAGSEGEFKLIEADTSKAVFAHKLDGAARLAFSPDGKTLATVTAAKTVQLWDAATGEEQAKLKGATARLSGLAFSPDGKRLAACGAEVEPNMPAQGTTVIWD